MLGAVLLALSALLHPGGLPGLLSVTADGRMVAIDWSAPPDDVAVIEEVAGGDVAGYVLRSVSVEQAGRSCTGEVAEADPASATLHYVCPRRVGTVTITSTILTDVDPAYQTLAVAPVVEGPEQVLFTGGRTSRTFVLADDDRDAAAVDALPLPGGAAFGLEERFQIALEDGGVGVVAVAAALLVGAAHALAPGHGKSIAAAYLVGARGRPRDALVLGLTVAGMHTVSVLALGAAVLVATSVEGLRTVVPWVAVAAGIAVSALGAWMMARRLRERRADPDPDPDPDHDHGHGHGHAHGHEHPPLSRGWLVLVGASGGLLPSPSALVGMLAAIGVGRTALGLAIVGAFSVGLAAAVTAFGLAAIAGRDLLRRLPRPTWWLPLAGSAAVLLAGLVLTARALRDAL